MFSAANGKIKARHKAYLSPPYTDTHTLTHTHTCEFELV